MICSMLTALLLFLLLLVVGRWIPYFCYFGYFGFFWLRVREFEFKNFAFRVGNESP